MLRRIFAAVLALVALGVAPLMAVTTTTPVPLFQDHYISLGNGPMLLGANGGSVIYQIADTQPAALSAGLGAQRLDMAPTSLQTTALVWAIGANPGVNAMVAAGSGISIGGGSVSGTVTANAGTNLNTSLLAVEAGGNLALTATAAGAPADAAYGGSGSASFIAALKGVYAKIAGTVTTSLAPTSSSSLAVQHGSVTALGTSLVLKNSAGNAYSYNCTAITGGAAGFCIGYNGTAAPAPGALTGANVLDACYFPAGVAGCSLRHGLIPANYSAGIVILVTSALTPFTYTTGVNTAFISGDFQ